jgi:hypothetical protein
MLKRGRKSTQCQTGGIQQSTKDKTGNSVITFERIGASGLVKKKNHKQWQCNQIAMACQGFKLSQKNNEEVCGVGSRFKILKPRQHKM